MYNFNKINFILILAIEGLDFFSTFGEGSIIFTMASIVYYIGYRIGFAKDFIILNDYIVLNPPRTNGSNMLIILHVF
jgi:hypothetical protein